MRIFSTPEPERHCRHVPLLSPSGGRLVSYFARDRRKALRPLLCNHTGRHRDRPRLRRTGRARPVVGPRECVQCTSSRLDTNSPAAARHRIKPRVAAALARAFRPVDAVQVGRTIAIRSSTRLASIGALVSPHVA